MVDSENSEEEKEQLKYNEKEDESSSGESDDSAESESPSGESDDSAESESPSGESDDSAESESPSGESDDSAESESLRGEPEHSAAKPPQVLSIQCLNMKSAAGKGIQIEAPGRPVSIRGKVIVEQIIKIYNDERIKELEKKLKRPLTDKDFKNLILYQYEKEWPAGDYFAISYCCENVVETHLLKAVSETKRKKVNHYSVVFFYRGDEKMNICIMTATSDKGYLVVKPYINVRAPFKILEKIGDPNKITWLSRQNILGKGTDEVLGSPSNLEFYKTCHLFYLIHFLICKMKKDSSLSSYFKKAIPSIKFTSSGTIRILKKMHMTDYPPILSCFHKYIEGIRTTNAKGCEEKKDHAFKFLQFLQTSQIKFEKLDEYLAKSIFNFYQQKKKYPYILRHRHLEDFVYASKFEINVSGSFQPIHQTPPQLENIVAKINEQDEKAFTNKIREGKLRFTAISEKKKPEKIIDFIEGELHYSNETYFKLKKGWYQCRTEYLPILDEDFRAVLRRTLMKEDEDGLLPLSWRGNDKSRGNLTNKLLRERLSDPENSISIKEASAIMSVLMKSKVCYVSSDNFVMQQDLCGQILETEIIEKHEDVINHILKNPGKSLQNKIKKACKEDAEKVLEELKKERHVLQNSSNLTLVLNPFPYTLKKKCYYDELKQLLNELYEATFTEKEEIYCRSYLKDINKGYLVYDQILPIQIEPCDILWTNADTVYLYHVKEKFGQHTRDVCSQILNAAQLFRDACSVHQTKSYSQILWDYCIDTTTLWFQPVKDKMLNIGKTKFVNMFREKKIVFVYAYLPDPDKSFCEESKKPSTITRDMVGEDKLKLLKDIDYLDSDGCSTNIGLSQTKKGFEKAVSSKRKLSKEDMNKMHKVRKEMKSSSSSTLAKMEIVRLAQNLAALNFDFKICEIPRKTGRQRLLLPD